MDIAEELSEIEVCLQNACVIYIFGILGLKGAEVVKLSAVSTDPCEGDRASGPESTTNSGRKLPV
jgi:hypothetical protein